MSEQFSNPQQALIERLRRAPQPELPMEVREAILGRVLGALEHPPLPVPRPRLLQPVAVIAIVAIVGALIAGGIFFVLSRQNQTVPLPTATATIQPSFTPSPTVTSTPTPTASPTVTIEPTITALPTTAVPAVVSSPVPTETLLPTLTSTATLQVTIAPSLQPTTGVSTIIVEGPVQTINVNIITVYNITIHVDPNDPILKTISVGDNVRVEGSPVSGTPQITVIAITVVVVNVNNGGQGNSGTGGSNPPPSSGNGEVWTDDGSCAHPPPDWAPANGWRRRCQGQTNNANNGSGNGNNNGNNNGNGSNNGNGNGNGDKPNKNDH
jgi:hypothetical protein